MNAATKRERSRPSRSVTFDPDQYKDLLARSEETGAPVSTLVEKALCQAGYGKTKPKKTQTEKETTQ